MKLRYPVVKPELIEDATYHISFYLKWGWIVPPIWIVQILWRECITDGHLKRIIKKTEGPWTLIDFKTDLLTRFAGLAIPMLTWIIGGLCFTL